MSSGTRTVVPVRKLDVEWVRQQFPALHQTVNGKAAVFLRRSGRDASAAASDRCHFRLSLDVECEHRRSVCHQQSHGPDDVRMRARRWRTSSIAPRMKWFLGRT